MWAGAEEELVDDLEEKGFDFTITYAGKRQNQGGGGRRI